MNVNQKSIGNGWVSLSGGDSYNRGNANIYSTVSVVFGMVNKIASRVATLDYLLDGEPYSDPNGLVIKSGGLNNLARQIAMSMLMKAQGYYGIFDSRLGTKKDVYFYSPYTCYPDGRELFRGKSLKRLTRTTNGVQKSYLIGKDGQAFYRYDKKDRLGWVWDSSINQWGAGIPPLEAAGMPASVIRSIDELAQKYFENGAIGTFIASVPQGTQDTLIAQFKDKLYRTLMRGLSTANDVLVLQSGTTDIKKISTDPKDMILTELDESNQRDIAMAFRTPLSILTGEASNRSVLDRNTANWEKDTVLPLAQMIVKSLNTHLFESMGHTLSINTIGVGETSEDTEAKALTLERVVKSYEIFTLMGNSRLTFDDFLVVSGIHVPDEMRQKLQTEPPQVQEVEAVEVVTDNIRSIVKAEIQAQQFEEAATQLFQPQQKSDAYLDEEAQYKRFVKKRVKRDKTVDPSQFEAEYLTGLDKARITAEIVGGSKSQDNPFTKNEPLQFQGIPELNAMLLDFNSDVDELAQQAINGDMTQQEFEDSFTETLLSFVTLAYAFAANKEVGNLTQADLSQISVIMEGQAQYIGNLSNDVFNGRYSARAEDEASFGSPPQTVDEGIAKIDNRLVLWGGVLTSAYYAALAFYDGDVLYRWDLGIAEHCDDCLRLNGQVHTMQEWVNAGWLPQTRRLECNGYNCECKLKRVEDLATTRDF